VDARLAGIDGERILGPAGRDGAGRLAGREIPAGMTRSAPPVSSVWLSRRKATDQTGKPGPARLRATLRVLRSMIVTSPPMLAAAMNSPLRDIASEVTGVDEARSASR